MLKLDKDTFHVHNANQHRLEKCSSSAAHAERMINHLGHAWSVPNRYDLVEVHRNKALDGAPYIVPVTGNPRVYLGPPAPTPT